MSLTPLLMQLVMLWVTSQKILKTKPSLIPLVLFRWISHPSINNPDHTKPTLFPFRSLIFHPNLNPSYSITTVSPHHSPNPNHNGLLYPYPKPCLTLTLILFKLKPYPNPNNITSPCRYTISKSDHNLLFPHLVCPDHNLLYTPITRISPKP